MTPVFERALRELFQSQDLPADAIQDAIGELMDGEVAEASAAALLTALRMKSESVGEIVGAARAMRARVTRIPTDIGGLLDTCGTGGDELHTFNISTAAALVVAAAGVPVAKHGNRSVSSSSGSADVLEALGGQYRAQSRAGGRLHRRERDRILFRTTAPQCDAVRCARATGARVSHDLQSVGAAYESGGSGVSTARCPGDIQAAEKLAHALAELGTSRAIVVCGNGELDEVSLWGETSVWIVESAQVRTTSWSAETFGVATCGVSELRVAGAEESVGVIRGVIVRTGRAGAGHRRGECRCGTGGRRKSERTGCSRGADRGDD